MTDPTPSYAYRSGLALLWRVQEPPPWMEWDERANAWVAPGHRYAELRRWAEEHGIRQATEGGSDGSDSPDAGGLDAPEAAPAGLPDRVFDPRVPRDYQAEALARWRSAGGRGSVVLPTGSGKTFVAILAIADVGRGACVVVPTRALVSQWYAQLVDAFGAGRVGAFYGEEKEVRAVTVTTYHSAFNLLERHGGRFELLVLDEAHHLADTAAGEATAFLDALRIAPAPRRLGLTATYPDDRDRGVRELVGPVVYRRAITEMADAELAAFAIERRFVALTSAERERYDALTAAYESWLAGRRYRERYPSGDDWWKIFMAETRTSPPARRAHRAFLERERLVALADGKLAMAERLLRLYPAEQAILFAGGRDAAERLSRRFAIPMVSADTPASERKAILDDIAAARVRAVVSVRVLDEGWDVPSAKLGIVLGDSTKGGRRQHAQRLGRLLRKQGERVASLYEVVASDTHEFFASQKRGAGLRKAAPGQLGLGL